MKRNHYKLNRSHAQNHLHEITKRLRNTNTKFLIEQLIGNQSFWGEHSPQCIRIFSILVHGLDMRATPQSPKLYTQSRAKTLPKHHI